VDHLDPAAPDMNDAPLHQMHDNPIHSAQFKRSFDLTPRGHKDIDVVFKNNLSDDAAIFHIVYNINQALPPGRHELVIRSFSPTTAPRYWRFVIVLNDGVLEFRPYAHQQLISDKGAIRPELTF
jgi:hypothetical protein